MTSRQRRQPPASTVRSGTPNSPVTATTALVVMVTALALGGCGSSEASSGQRDGATGERATTARNTPHPSVAPSAPMSFPGMATPSRGAPTQPPTPPSADASCPDPSGCRTADPPVPGAWPGAGGDRPRNSRPASRVDQFGTATVTTPSRNTGCDLHEDDFAVCGVLSYRDDEPAGGDRYGPRWHTVIEPDADRLPVLTSSNDPDSWVFPASKAQVLQYGQVVHHGPFVCASARSGLTCWSTRSGHGALLSRDAFRPF